MESATMTPPARLTLFGFKPAAAEVEVIRRSDGWRASRAFGSLLAALVLAPLTFVLPLHLPWPIVTVCVGIYLFFRYWTQEYTLVAFSGVCPKCGAPQQMKLPTPLRASYRLTCGSCMQEIELEVETPREAGARPAGE